ncbi:hypothetical protein ACI65C_000262 [Semiaphis heraclei]
MVEENRTGFGQMDIVDDDNMVRLPRQRIVDMYKNAMSRVRVLEAKANEDIFDLINQGSAKELTRFLKDNSKAANELH